MAGDRLLVEAKISIHPQQWGRNKGPLLVHCIGEFLFPHTGPVGNFSQHFFQILGGSLTMLSVAKVSILSI